MKLKEAMDIIESNEIGYMVSFELQKGGMLHSDYFPDKHAQEDLIETIDEAWELAKRFAMACKKNDNNVVNVYVIDQTFSPVIGYEQKMLNKL